MSVVCVSYRTISLNELEADHIIFEENKARSVLSDLVKLSEISEVILLSTCLRTEIYVELDKFHVGIEYIYSVLSKHTEIDSELLAKIGTVYFEDQAVLHLFNVASGLESVVVGEGEILGQVKKAQLIAQELHSTGPQLNLLFKNAIEVGKKVRHDTQLSSGITSMAHASVAITASHIGSRFSSMNISVLGAGEMGRTVVKALVERHGAKSITIINRSISNAENLAKKFSISYDNFANLLSSIKTSEVLFVATSSSDLLLTAEMLTKVMDQRDTPLVVCDLSVPRNVEHEVAYVKGVTLFGINDITRFVEKNKESKSVAVQMAQTIVNEKLIDYKNALEFKGIEPLITELVSRIDQLKLEFLKKNLKDKSSYSKDEVEQLLNQLTSAIAHLPISQLKDNTRSAKDQKLIDATKLLFGLE